MASMTTELQSTLSSKKASQVMPRGMMLRTLVSTTALHSPWRLVTVAVSPRLMPRRSASAGFM